MSCSDFDNWEPVDDDQESPNSPKEASESSLGLPFQATTDNSKIKPSTSPIRSIQNSTRDSISSMDSTALKSMPADPQLAEVDPVTGVNSPPNKNASALSSVSNIIDSTKGVDRIDETDGLPSSSFFNNMLSSLSFNNGGKPSTHSRALSESSTQGSPNIISYRKSTPSRRSRRSISVDNEIPTSPLQQMEKPEELLSQDYDKRLYIDEKLAETPYRFAVEARNEEFHNIFKSVPDDDRLLDDFSCALSREFLFQGRIYVSQFNICFNSNLLGWITNLVISLKDVVAMEKTSTAGLFPNGISIETHLGKHQFASFISRDTTFEFIKTVWRAFRESEVPVPPLTRQSSSLSNVPDAFPMTNRELTLKILPEIASSEIPSSRASIISENDSKIDDAILSVDDFTPSIAISGRLKEEEEDGEDDEDDYDEEGEDEIDYDDYEEDENSLKSHVLKGNSTVIVSDEEEGTLTQSSLKIFKLKENSGYEYDGPTYFQETSFVYVPEDNNEYVLAELELNAPPGVVYQLMFSNENSAFLIDFLKSQKSSQISPITGFDNVNKDGQQYREYNYAKALNYSVGPKSTKCQVLETVLNMDYENYINVLNTTKTPDVPSGNSFSVKTRYMMRWASANSSILKISFWVDWTGSSWIKSMVDKSCKAGQIEATKTMVDLINEYINKYVEEGKTLVAKQPRKKQPQSRRVSKTSSRSYEPVKGSGHTSGHEQTNENQFQGDWFSKSNTVVILLFINMVLLCLVILHEQNILRQIKKADSNNRIYSSSFTIDQVLNDLRNIFKESKESVSSDFAQMMKSSEELEIWDWLNERAEQNKNYAMNDHKRDRYQRYLYYMVRQWVRGEIAPEESQDFLQRLDKLMKIVSDSKGISDKTESEPFNVSKIKNAVDYLINI